MSRVPSPNLVHLAVADGASSPFRFRDFGLHGVESHEKPRRMWEFPKIRGTLFWGPYNKDPII